MYDNINYYCIDNMEYMENIPDKYYDLAIADPPQGKKEHGGTNRCHWTKQKNGSKLFVKDGNFKKKNWDLEPASIDYFNELFRISKHQIIWGEQYYGIYFGKGRIIWDKCNSINHQYDCEIAYTSLNDRVTLFRYMWSGMMQGKSISEGHIVQGNKKLNEKRRHSTHKPSKLYQWTFNRFNIPKEWKLFDPNLGSGSIGIAALKLGYSLDACENDKEQFDIALNWLNEERKIINSTLNFNANEK